MKEVKKTIDVMEGQSKKKKLAGIKG